MYKKHFNQEEKRETKREGAKTWCTNREGSGDTFTATGPDDQNLIFLYIVSSKPFSDFRKFFPIENFFFEKFRNYRRELPNGSFDRKFYTEKL